MTVTYRRDDGRELRLTRPVAVLEDSARWERVEAEAENWQVVDGPDDEPVITSRLEEAEDS